ncbi:tRNA (cytosine(72)-C(5))-methyltransferase NSUN6 isoform X1 [Maniola hyperantus]|uniref:tRNA (cytosine(72)-C(5))-methyltransferase NSUN6 isoform X1 n=1 Tax=Aphantopus hyperantus TaxID=2795564 RepID=UPI001569075B|nr:tRNA (cytosine(72)-C(5))-methyltransferase NSUN6 [Maniola hyperantus]
MVLGSLQSWLSKAPNYTIFRVNRLTKFDCTNLQKYLEAQSKTLNSQVIPKITFVKPDCIVIESWPTDIAVERSGNEVIVDSMCAAAVLRGAHVYAPGVLGLAPSCQLDEKVDIYADLDGQCKRGLKVQYDGHKQYVGTGQLKMLRYELFDNGIQANGIAIHTLLPASRLPVINETVCPKGQLLLQNFPSIVAGWVVDAKPYEHILDMCAAPGNKTTHLAEMSDNKACIIAIDKTEQKVAKIKQSCEIQGVSCVNAYVYDSRKCHSDGVADIKYPPFPSNTFDKVLLDAPCSGLGQRPQLSDCKMTQKMLQSYKFVQRQLFDAAVQVLKLGGKLVYSTCTVTVDENEGMVAWVLEKFPCLQLIPAEPYYGGPGLPNVGLSDEQRIMVQRFWPEEDPLRKVQDLSKNTIGFFIAAFIKINYLKPNV